MASESPSRRNPLQKAIVNSHSITKNILTFYVKKKLKFNNACNMIKGVALTRYIMLGITVISLYSDGYPAPQDSFSTGYNRGLSIESWRVGFNFQKTFSSLNRFHISENLLSSRLQITPDIDKWKDQHKLSLNFSRILSHRVHLNLVASSFIFSDKQSGYINDIRTHFMIIGATYHRQNLRIPAFIGVKQDRRFQQTDQGLTYSIGTELPYFALGEYINRFNAAYERDHLHRRKNSTLTVSYLVNRQFYTDTSDSLRLTLNNQRRDYYISNSGEIESREEKSRGADNTLMYRIGTGLRCRLRGVISSRFLRISLISGPHKGLKRERKDFHTLGIIHILLRRSSFRGDMTFSYSSEEQKYILAETLPTSPYSGSMFLITPDNRSAYTTLTLRTGWRFSPSDSLILNMRLHRFRYDTPDPKNFDDRDELRFRMDLQENHSFSPTLNLRLALSLHLLHFVYIYGERSADNNWTRILRFNPTVSWQPSSRWRFSQSVEIMANYVAYDYESHIPGIRSFLYRKFRLEDSTRVQISQKLSLQLLYRLELDENGKFIWDQWLEQKLMDRQSHTFVVSLNFKPWKNLNIISGYTVYSRRGYRYTASLSTSHQKDLSVDFRNHGPSLGIRYKSDRLYFLLTGSTTATETLHTKKQLLTRVNFNMSWAL